MNIHITGANGFVGQALVQLLMDNQFAVFPWVRRTSGMANELIIPDFEDFESIFIALKKCDVFIHLAAKVHQIDNRGAEPHNDYNSVNSDLTLAIARAASDAGVRHFVFISSVKVNGESNDSPWVETDQPIPVDPYGYSKLDAENRLMTLSHKTGMMVTIIRPPLVYGPGVGANFLSLMNWLFWSLPVPFKLIENKRSLIFVGNLVSAIAKTIVVQPKKSSVYFVSDDQDFSTQELGRLLSKYIGSIYLSLPISPRLLHIIGRFLGKEAQISRLLGSLQINSSSFRNEFHWLPPYSLEEGIAMTANWFRHYQQERRQFLVKRFFDVALSLFAVTLLITPALLIALLVKLTSKGPVLYWSDRVGVNNRLFRMPKFRSMKTGAPAVATHILVNPDEYLTPIGRFLRQSSLDELPQLLSVLRGEMSLVGPRPALFNQHDLIALRTQHRIHLLLPGITGWAQINGRDDLALPMKVRYDREYLERKSFFFDSKVLIWTIFKILRAKNISH